MSGDPEFADCGMFWRKTPICADSPTEVPGGSCEMYCIRKRPVEPSPPNTGLAFFMADTSKDRVGNDGAIEDTRIRNRLKNSLTPYGAEKNC